MSNNDIFVFILYRNTIFSECHEENEKTCLEQEGSNSCKKINGVDTCVCGNSRECNPHKRNKLCLNGKGKKIKDDSKAKCRPGKSDSYFVTKAMM